MSHMIPSMAQGKERQFTWNTLNPSDMSKSLIQDREMEKRGINNSSLESYWAYVRSRNWLMFMSEHLE